MLIRTVVVGVSEHGVGAAVIADIGNYIDILASDGVEKFDFALAVVETHLLVRNKICEIGNVSERLDTVVYEITQLFTAFESDDAKLTVVENIGH